MMESDLSNQHYIMVPTRIRFLITPVLSKMGQISDSGGGGGGGGGIDAPNMLFMKRVGLVLSVHISPPD